MPAWPFARPSAPPPPSPAPPDLFVTEELLRGALDDVLALRERQIHGSVIAFRGALRVPPARALAALEGRFARFGYVPFLRPEGDEVVVQAWRLPPAEPAPRRRLNAVLFLLTCCSTLLAGWFFAGSPTFEALREAGWPLTLLTGVPFAVTLLAILGVHEFGHYFAARHYRALVSLPYFIPAPPPFFLFGTLGAIIRMRSPVRDRNALFDIAAAGPLAGLAVALPAMLVGLAWSRVTPVPAGEMLVFGDSLLMHALSYLRFGAVPPGMMVYTHPVADAAWAGFLVTAINLFPVGQLDGGRIAFALFGRHHGLIGRLTVVGMVLLGLVTGAWTWFVWATLITFMVGFRHQPPLDDLSPLSRSRRLVGYLCLLLFVLLLPPVPIS